MPVVPATEEAIGRGATRSPRGDIVAFPTETVYGLGANALDARAVAKVFAAKERPRFNPLIVHVPGLAEAEDMRWSTDTARHLAEAFWPGPLSLVLKKRPSGGIADLVSAGLDTIALRVPAHPVAQALLEAAKLPIAAPSANRSGRISPTTAAHVEAELDDRPAMILDGGPCPLGIEFDGGRRAGRRRRLCSGPARCRARRSSRCSARRLLRPQPTIAALRRDSSRRHYAPTTPLRLNVTRPEAGRGPARVRADVPECDGRRINLSPTRQSRTGGGQTVRGAARARPIGATAIAVMPIPAHGLGEAINDRLRRAANRR